MSPQVRSRKGLSIEAVLKPKSVKKLRSLPELLAAKRISSKDFKFPPTPVTPQGARSAEWTPGSGFTGLSVHSTTSDAPWEPPKRKGRHSNLIHNGKLKLMKAVASASPDEEGHLSPMKRRRKNRHANNKDNASSAFDSAKARNLFSLASHSSAGESSRDPSGLSQPEITNYRKQQPSRSKRYAIARRSLQVLEKETSTKWSPKPQAGGSLKDAQTPEEPILQKEQIRDGGPILGIHEKLITETRTESQQSQASKERSSSRPQYDNRTTSTDAKLRGGIDTIRQALYGPFEPIDKAAVTVPHLAHLHPTLSALQTPISNTTKHESSSSSSSSSSESGTSTEEDLTTTEAETEVLDSSPQPASLPRRHPHQRRSKTNKQIPPPTPSEYSQPPSPFASYLSFPRFTPSSQPTDPRARLQMLDSQLPAIVSSRSL